MYLSSRDIKWAIDCQQFFVDPRPEELIDQGTGYDETSIDLHLASAKEAKVWDIARYEAQQKTRGAAGPELYIGTFEWGAFSKDFLVDPPDEASADTERKTQSVFKRGKEVIIKPWGFVLWPTRERVGTPKVNPGFISFVNAKSTKARAGVIVHLTAPTIHAGWDGKIILEISNMGPFHFVLKENDVIAQLTIATISSPPDISLKKGKSQTAGQAHATGES